MLKSHEKFHSANGKRLVLVAEDEEINRDLLGAVLKDDYEVLFASDGKEALRMIQEHQNMLSVVLLDLVMPGMGGLELLERLKDDHALQLIPVIVITSDQDSEIKSLTLGAADFIPKPYPAAGVILARLRRTIELFEDRLTIQTTERDPLTNLYNREFFYHYAELFDQYHESLEMDAIVIDIYHFRVINERFGNAYGDEVLKRIGLKVREMVSDTGGIVCRREADTFMVYCPHGKDYKKILDSASHGLAGEDIPVSRVRLRMGVYAKVDRSLPIERRFDRAKMAADMIRNSYTKSIEIYDHKLHEREVYEQQLVEGFHQGLVERQFHIYYQPKFDIRPEKPVLSSAEGLVRWMHPDLGFISPGDFIPLFEDNGLIEELDFYVWDVVAGQIRDWKDRYGFSIPVSVNVSRVDMYDPHLEERFLDILDKYRLEPEDLLLEVTESAYTQDSDQIISTVDTLRKAGFRIEMDDFGNGYSSLNMISTLPIDALKLDMDFVQNAFRKRRDTRMLEIIIDIADYLSVPVIAEGVETQDQMEALKAIGCDIVQGYYFSRPVPAKDFEKFLQQRISSQSELDRDLLAMKTSEKRLNALGRIANALSSGFEFIYYIDINTGHYVEFSSEGQRDDLKVDRSGNDFFGDVVTTIERNVYQGDREEVLRCMQKDALLEELKDNVPFSLIFRMIVHGEPLYYNLKAVRTSAYEGNHRIVIGITNVDHEVKTSGAFEYHHSNPVNFSNLANALTIDMERIYYVDAETDNYLEYRASGNLRNLPMEMTGQNFFEEFRKNLLRVVYEPDREKISTALIKRSLLDVLHKRGVFVMLYRLVIDRQPVYYRMKAVQANEDDNHHIIVGVTNVNQQITEEERLEASKQDAVTYAGIAKALSKDYYSIYIVDKDNDHFYEYDSEKSYKRLGIDISGENFFQLSRQNAAMTIYPEDRVRFLNHFTKENILKAIEERGIFTMTYRLLIDNVPTFVSMKISPLGGQESSQLVVGINNINNDIQEREKVLTYSNISRALAGSYYSVYYVDLDTEEYIELASHEEFAHLDIEKSGDQFFQTYRKQITKLIYPDDRENFLKRFTKESVITSIAEKKPFVINYRQRLNKRWTYLQLKATAVESPRDRHIVIGISSIDEGLRLEEEHLEAMRIVSRDPLTGVKSRYVYLDDERAINQEIAKQTVDPFAVVFCDLNNLKQINDTYGHTEGDEFIKQACRTICHIYKRSPVYRIGGDEFVVILRGEDYQNRDYLYKMVKTLNYAQNVGRRVVIACGMSVYEPGKDTSISDVMKRADAAMYENKKKLKQDLGD